MDEEKQGTPTPPPADMLGALLSNPEMLQRLGGLLGGMMQASATPAPEKADSNPPTAPSTASEQSAAPTSASLDGLGTILSNPAMMEKLPQIIAMMKPLLASMPPPNPSSATNAHGNDRERLLLALKPFLSPERCEAVDTILHMSRLGSVFQQLK